MNYEEAKQQLKIARYCNKKLIRINQEIEVLRHQMTGLARGGPELTPEQAKSPLPLPHYQHDPNASPVALIEACEAKEKEAELMRRLILSVDWLELLDKQDQDALIEVYLLHHNYDQTAQAHGYTKKGLWKHLKAEIERIE